MILLSKVIIILIKRAMYNFLEANCTTSQINIMFSQRQRDNCFGNMNNHFKR